MEKHYLPVWEKTKYIILVCFQIMTMCAGFGFAVQYLYKFGISDKVSGILIGVSCIVAVVVNPYIGKIADKSINLDVKKFILIFTSIQGVCAVILMLLSSPIVQCISFTIILCLVWVITPLVNSIGFLSFEKTGIKINYGIARGFGSLSYAVTAALLGLLIKNIGEFCIPSSILIFVIIQIVITCFIPINNEVSKSSEEKSFSLKIRDYPSFFFVILGFSLIMISYNMIAVYLIRIIENVGGNSANMGIAAAIAAISEVPALLLYTCLAKRFSSHKLLAFSGCAFLVKIFLFIFAQSVVAIYLLQILQILSYGIFVAARVYYTEETLPRKYRTRGQAYSCMTETFGMVMGSIIGGYILSESSVSIMLIIGMITCLLGLFFVLYSFLVKKKVN